ncbi:MAG: hypothetical protein ABMB14_10720, partial [Myxococcota bacterium]
TAPLAAADGAVYQSTSGSGEGQGGFASTWVDKGLDGQWHGGALVTTVPWIGAWTWESWLTVTPTAPGHPLVVARMILSNANLASVTAVAQAEPADAAETRTVTWDLVLTCDADRGGTAALHAEGQEIAAVRFGPGAGPCGGRAGRWTRLAFAVGPHAEGGLSATVAVGAHTNEGTLAPLVGARAITIRAGVGAAPVDRDDRGAAVRLDDLALHADTAAIDGPRALAERPYDGARWCEPVHRGRLPYLEPFDRVEFGVRGYYLGVAGAVLPRRGPTEAPAGAFAARQRMVVGAEAQLSRNTLAVLQVRTLETRGVASTGSMLTVDADAPATTTLRDVALTVEQAFVTRNSNHRRSPLFFAAGRLPVSLGAGIAAQNGYGAIDPPPWSPVALFGEQVPETPGTRVDATSDRVFPTTLDGLAAGLRFRRGLDQSAEWVSGRIGRHLPWCSGRTIEAPADAAVAAADAPGWDQASRDACPTEMRSVYEAAVAVTVASHRVFRSDRPNVVTAAGEVGVRYTDGGGVFRPDGSFGALSALVVMPRSLPTWVRVAGDAMVEVGVEPDPGDELLLPLELAGSTLGAAGQVDVASHRLPLVILSVAAGGATAIPSWLDLPGNPDRLRGLHPDFDVDLVGFEHVVATATADAYEQRTSDDLPSLGGVYEGAYLRLAPTIRLAEVAEVPLAVLWERTGLDLPGVLGPGWLGTEVDVGLRIHAAGWRFGFAWGRMVHRGDGWLDGTLPRSAVSVRLARNL